jgi:putative addiction module component (TIGR02574 family)
MQPGRALARIGRSERQGNRQPTSALSYPSLLGYDKVMDSSYSPAELYQQALKLSAGDRAVLAGLLLDSLDASTEDNVDEAWRAEIERRMHELDTGAVTPVAWEQVRARLSQGGAA